MTDHRDTHPTEEARLMSTTANALDAPPTCECGRAPVVACAFKRNTSLLVRRIGDMGHHGAADWRCADCIADMAEDVAGSPIRPFHRDFQPSEETP